MAASECRRALLRARAEVLRLCIFFLVVRRSNDTQRREKASDWFGLDATRASNGAHKKRNGEAIQREDGGDNNNWPSSKSSTADAGDVLAGGGGGGGRGDSNCRLGEGRRYSAKEGKFHRPRQGPGTLLVPTGTVKVGGRSATAQRGQVRCSRLQVTGAGGRLGTCLGDLCNDAPYGVLPFTRPVLYWYFVPDGAIRAAEYEEPSTQAVVLLAFHWHY